MMMIILLCIFLSITVFFTAYFILLNLNKLGLAIKIRSNKKRKPDTFADVHSFSVIERLAYALEKLKLKKFVYLIERNEKILQLLGKKYRNLNPYKFFAIQILFMFVGMLFGALFISMKILVILSIGLIFFYLPILKIKEELKKRKESILKQLPEMSELLCVMLESGLDFYGASEKIGLIIKGPLIDEFKSALAKISLGYDKKRALNEMAENTGVESVFYFVRTINTALESGTQISDTLKRMSLMLRNEKFSYAQKKAQECPIKMLIPLTLLIFPTIFIVIFGPIAINFIKDGF
ncbi:MAG: type II secretion system F family protein [Endomicrobium sp.]|jgi:tight adherence protein C|nr:type II secretion system F family protein [Endomicrobium sp.]